MTKVDKVNYSDDFDNLYLKMDDFDKFFRTGKVFCNMLRYMPGLAKVGYQVQLHSTEMKGNMQMTLTKTKKLWNSMFN